MGNPTLRAAAVRAAAKRAERARPPHEHAGTQPAEPAEPASCDPSSAERTGLLRVVLVVLVVLGAAATALLAHHYREAERAAQARTAALTAAHKAAPAVLSYDYRHLDRDFATARSHLTGPFLDQYEKTTTTVVAPMAKKYHGVVKATVAKPQNGDASPAASVVSASPDKAVVLLFMNQVTTSTQVSTPRLDLNRVRMTLVRGSQGWKVSAVDAQ